MQFASHSSLCSPVNIASFASLSGTQSSLCPHHFAKTASQAAPGVSLGFQVTDYGPTTWLSLHVVTARGPTWSLSDARTTCNPTRDESTVAHQCPKSLDRLVVSVSTCAKNIRSFWIHIPGTMKKINNSELWIHLAQLALRNFSEVLWATWRFHCSTFFWQTPGWIHFLPFPSVSLRVCTLFGGSMDMGTFWGSNPFYTYGSIKLLGKSTKLAHTQASWAQSWKRVLHLN